jgi:hypothetical protein
MARSVDPWDEVWDAYEARQAPAAPEPPPPCPAEPRGGRRWRMPLVAVMVFGLGCATGSAWPVLNLYALVLRQDMPALLRQLDPAPAREGLRQGLRAHAGLRGEAETNGAERLLAGMAEEMAAALARPGGWEQLLLARREEALPPRDPAAPPLWLRPAAWGGTAVELAPREGPGGFRLELAWTGRNWRAVAARLLDAPAVPAPAWQAALPLPRPG